MFYAVDHVLWYIGVLQGPETRSVSAVRTINMFYGPNTCSMLHATVSTDHGTCSMDHRTVPFGHRPFWCMGSQPKPLNHLSSLIAEAGFLKHWKLCESRLVPPGGFLKHPHDKLQQQQQQQQDCSKDLKQGPNGSVLFIWWNFSVRIHKASVQLERPSRRLHKLSKTLQSGLKNPLEIKFYGMAITSPHIQSPTCISRSKEPARRLRKLSRWPHKLPKLPL